MSNQEISCVQEIAFGAATFLWGGGTSASVDKQLRNRGSSRADLD